MTIFDTVNSILKKSLKNKLFVLYDKFAMTGRNSYGNTHNLSITRMLSDVVLSDYGPWGYKTPPICFTKEEKIRIRSLKGLSYDAILYEQLKKYIVNQRKKPIILTWFETERRRKLAKSTGGKLLAMPGFIRNKLEDKANFNSILKSSGIPKTNKLKTKNFNDAKKLPSYKKMVDLFGKIFVVQGRSMGGDGTVIVRGKKDFEYASLNLKDRIRVSEYCPSQYFSSNILNVPLKDNKCAVYVDIPSHKIAGIPELGIPEVTGAGQDWSLLFSKSFAKKYVDFVVQIGQFLYKNYHLIGLWSLEGFWDNNNVYFNELNCRPGGDTEVSSINQVVKKFPPFFAVHTLVFLKTKLDWLPSAEDFNEGTINEIFQMKNTRPFYLKVRVKGRYPVKCVSQFPGSGIYKLTNDNRLKWLRAGCSTLDANFDKDEVLIADAPLNNTVCHPGIQLCTLEGISRNKHIFNGPKNLSNEASRLTKAVYKYFEKAENSKITST